MICILVKGEEIRTELNIYSILFCLIFHAEYKNVNIAQPTLILNIYDRRTHTLAYSICSSFDQMCTINWTMWHCDRIIFYTATGC